MALRLNSLKTRTALAISSVIVVILVANAVYLILTKQRELRRDIEERALTFAQLSRAPICAGYDTYYASGFFKFRELMREYLLLDQDVERVLIIGVSGELLFDSTELDNGAPRPEGAPVRRIEDPAKLEALTRMEPTVLHGRGPDGKETLEIIAPHFEEWGRHKMSVDYIVSYKNLTPSIRRLVYATAGLTLLSILVSIMVAVTLATRITRPLEELTAGAQDIAEGHFDRRLQIRGGDEMQILAEAFNDMTGRLKENVDELEESNKKLAAVNEELKELDRMKSDLLANVSHELRTPLTAIKGYTDYILDRKLGPVTEKQEKGMVVVQRNLERLSKTINALLDFSRMEMGRITLSIQPFSLPQLVEQIHTTIRSEMEKKRLTFHAVIDPALGLVIADREKVSAVLENLVINATKFTPEEGSITISATRVRGAARPTAVIRVSDTGMGIPQHQLDKIFMRFHQVDGSTTRRFGGVGLGLAIVKSILDAHGTAISVDSAEGRGTEFRFTLPVLDKPSGEHDAHQHLSTVMIVEEEPDTADTIREGLRAEGFVTVVAHDGREALDAIARRRPDLVILDVTMKELAGYSVMAGLRGSERTSGIPVVVLTARGAEGDGQRDQAPGACRYMSKPLDVRALVSEVRTHLGNAQEHPEGAPRATV